MMWRSDTVLAIISTLIFLVIALLIIFLVEYVGDNPIPPGSGVAGATGYIGILPPFKM